MGLPGNRIRCDKRQFKVYKDGVMLFPFMGAQIHLQEVFIKHLGVV